MNFATTAHQVERTCPAGAFSLFSGRRTPHPPFHLLQHMYMADCLGGMATSSLFAGRCLGGSGMPQQLIGTLAHEGPMGFMCLHSELDANLPMSSLLWHLLFWGMIFPLCHRRLLLLPVSQVRMGRTSQRYYLRKAIKCMVLFVEAHHSTAVV